MGKTIADLKKNENVSMRLLLSSMEVRTFTSRTGEERARLVMNLLDKTGSIEGTVWNNPYEVAETLEAGRVVDVRATVGEYNQTLNLNVAKVVLVPKEEVSISDYLPATTADVDKLMNEIRGWIESIKNPGLKGLLRTIFFEDDKGDQFREAIAATFHHHNYIGGLVEHTYGVTRLARAFAKFYGFDKLDPTVMDFVTAGGLLHDIGKTDSYTWTTGFDVTLEGMLLGHLTQGMLYVQKLVVEEAGKPEPRFTMDEQTLLRLQHLIASHHGKREFGAIEPPSTLEAAALHMADYADSQLNKVHNMMAATPPGAWTPPTNLFGERVQMFNFAPVSGG